MGFFKEQYTKEKERVAEISFRLEERERELKETLKYKDEVNQKKTFLDNKVRELHLEIENMRYRQDSGRGDEEFSLQKNMMSEYEDQIAKLEQENRRLRNQSGGEGIIKEINAQLDRVLIEKKNAEDKTLNEKRENADLRRELESVKREYSQFKDENNNKIAEIINDLNISTESCSKLQNRISVLEKDKSGLEHVSSENERLKKERENYLQEMKSLYKEKDEVQQKVMEGKEEIHKLQNVITQRETLLKALEIEKEKTENKLKEALENERLVASELKIIKNKSEVTDSTVDKIKYLELERDINKFSSEVSNLKLNLREKDDQLNSILAEKALREQELNKKMEEKEKEMLSEFEKKLEKKEEEISQKSSEISFLQRSRDEITNSWNKEMKLMSIVIHEIGMDLIKTNRTLKDDTWLNAKRFTKN